MKTQLAQHALCQLSLQNGKETALNIFAGQQPLRPTAYPTLNTRKMISPTNEKSRGQLRCSATEHCNDVTPFCFFVRLFIFKLALLIHLLYSIAAFVSRLMALENISVGRSNCPFSPPGYAVALLPCLTLSMKGTVWCRTSRQVRLCTWEGQLAGLYHPCVLE